MRLLLLRLVAAVFAVGIAGLPAVASASVVNNRVSGLAAPDVVIDFGNGLHTNGTVIASQFASSGVTFGPTYGYTTQPDHGPSVAFGGLVNGTPTVQPGSIFFTSNVSAAVFSWRTETGSTNFKAYLDGVLIGLLNNAPTNLDTPSAAGKFYGFEGIVFNEIRLEIIFTAGNSFTLDNLQYDIALSPVPLPAALPLYGTGLVFMGFIGWRRRRRAKPGRPGRCPRGSAP